MKPNVLMVIVLLFLGGVLGFAFIPIQGEAAHATPMQVASGRYVPLVRSDMLIVVDTQTGRAWREILSGDEDRGGVLIEFRRLSRPQ